MSSPYREGSAVKIATPNHRPECRVYMFEHLAPHTLPELNIRTEVADDAVRLAVLDDMVPPTIFLSTKPVEVIFTRGGGGVTNFEYRTSDELLYVTMVYSTAHQMAYNYAPERVIFLDEQDKPFGVESNSSFCNMLKSLRIHKTFGTQRTVAILNTGSVKVLKNVGTISAEKQTDWFERNLFTAITGVWVPEMASHSLFGGESIERKPNFNDVLACIYAVVLDHQTIGFDQERQTVSRFINGCFDERDFAIDHGAGTADWLVRTAVYRAMIKYGLAVIAYDAVDVSRSRRCFALTAFGHWVRKVFDKKD